MTADLEGIAIFLFIAVGIYLIGKGVNRDFDLLQTGTGYLFLLSGLVALAVGIIHGDLVPRFLTVSENVSTAPGIDVSATCYRLSKNIRVNQIEPRDTPAESEQAPDADTPEPAPKPNSQPPKGDDDDVKF